MGEMLKTSFVSYAGITLFVGLLFTILIRVILKKDIETSNRKIVILARILICIILVSVWLSVFVSGKLYPISLAYYEYVNGLDEQAIGTINSIEYLDKDHVRIIVDEREYVLVYGSTSLDLSKGYRKGDEVCIQYGKKSKYVFAIEMTDE